MATRMTQLKRRWPGSPRTLRSYDQLREPTCMQIVLATGALRLRPYILPRLYTLYTTDPAFKTGSLFRQHALMVRCTARCLADLGLSGFDGEQVSSVAALWSHYLLHGLHDNGDAQQDDCFTMLDNPRTRQFNWAIALLQRLDLLWIEYSGYTQHALDLIVLSYLVGPGVLIPPETIVQSAAADEALLKSVRAYPHEPIITSTDDASESQKLAMGPGTDSDRIIALMQMQPVSHLLNMLWTIVEML